MRQNCQCTEKLNKNVPKCTHVLFDMDGVITDTEPVYEIMINEILSQFGHKLDSKINAKRKGMKGTDVAILMCQTYNLPITPEEFRKNLTQLYPKYLPDVHLKPGVEKLINHLANNKIPIAVATASTQLSYDLKIQNHRSLFQKFHHVTLAGSDPDIKHGKPHPDIFIVCASRFDDPKPLPEQCLVIEDAYNGILAAFQANMYSVLVPDKDIPEDVFEYASVIVASLEDLDLPQFGIPALK